MEQFILFAFLSLFPFGQIIKIGLVNPIDIIVLIGAIWVFVKKLPKPQYFKYVNSFLLILFFGNVLSLFASPQNFNGFLYLIRLTSYFYFSVLVFNFRNNKILINGLIVSIVFSAIFGWIQYLWFPDFRPFTIFGWDDHYFRLSGTFMDPNFLGIILVLGSILAFYKKNYVAFTFLAFSLLFTLSRSSYIAFLVFLGFNKKILLVFIFLISILLMPKPTGEGGNLIRTASINARLINYSETLNTFKNNPLFGVGFGNKASDSSLLMILSTTGIAGFISFVYMVYRISYIEKQHTTYNILHTTFLAIIVHSLFINSMFYPWVMGLFMILLGSKVKG